MKTFYVWGGSLRGTRVLADTPREAAAKAITQNLPCVLLETIRVSLRPKGPDPHDVYIEAPYERYFPELFADTSMEIEVRRVTRE